MPGRWTGLAGDQHDTYVDCGRDAAITIVYADLLYMQKQTCNYPEILSCVPCTVRKDEDHDSFRFHRFSSHVFSCRAIDFCIS